MRKIDYFVVDTNTLVSAFILPSSVARKAVDKARKVGLVVLSKNTANEFKDVFIRSKFDRYLSLEIRLEIIDDFLSLVHWIEPNETIKDCRDPKDNKFLELAIAANATCIITGDQDLLVLNPYRNVPILNSSDFLNNSEI